MSTDRGTYRCPAPRNRLRMNQKTYLRLMLALSVIYGMLIALLAVLQTGGIGVVAIVGGLVLALGWALSGIVAKRPS